MGEPLLSFNTGEAKIQSAGKEITVFITKEEPDDKEPQRSW